MDSHLLQWETQYNRFFHYAGFEVAKYQIYTDGSYLASSGDGGYASLLVEDNVPLFCIRDALPKIATNNIMELEAIRQAMILCLSFDPSEFRNVEICSDSAYAMNAISKWADGWSQKNWKTSTGSDVANKDLIQNAHGYWLQCRRYRVELVKVKAHATCYWNNVVDELAKGIREGVCGGCFQSILVENSKCLYCSRSRSEAWLSRYRPSLSRLKRGL